MAVTYQTPGVYIEEVDAGPKPIEAVGTSTAAFIGVTQKAEIELFDPVTRGTTIESVLNKATLVTNWTQYTNSFGGFVDGIYLPDAVYAYFNNGGGPCYITSIKTTREMQKDVIAEVDIPSVEGGVSFTVKAKKAGEDGHRLQVVIIGEDDDNKTFTMQVGSEKVSGLTTDKDYIKKRTSAASKTESEDGSKTPAPSTPPAKKEDSGITHISQAEFETVTIEKKGMDGHPPTSGSYAMTSNAISSAPLSLDDIVGSLEDRTGLSGLEALDDVRLVLCPDMMIGYEGSDDDKERIKSIQEAIITHCENMGYRFALLDTPQGLNAQQAKEWRNYINFDSSYAALYYPWLKVADLGPSSQTSKAVPPSGHIVGIYNRVDADRGVHKAPANEVVRGAIDVELHLSHGEQKTLNPIGVNCIRSFPGRGIRVWGARTLSSDPSWRYISVRRLFILVGASLDQGMQWVVFEPNDSTLWAKVLRDTNAFLRTIWRSGALFGVTPEQAFYVKCDEELNPSEIRDLGQLIIEIGLSPVKPAEFVIFRISQWAGANAE